MPENNGAVFTLTREDVIECVREMGMPAEVITDDVLCQIKNYLRQGKAWYWSEFIKHAINYALKN